MKRIIITVPDETANTLARLVAVCNDSHDARDGFTSHGKLTVASLLAILAEDGGDGHDTARLVGGLKHGPGSDVPRLRRLKASRERL